jgi:hypothetical protein
LDAREYGGSNASAYAAGLRIRFIPDTTNASGTLTAKIGSLASTPLKKSDGTNFAIGEFKTNCIYTFVYDATGATSFKQDSVLTSNEDEFDYYFYMCMAILNWIETFTQKDIFQKSYELLTDNFSFEKELKRSPLSSLTGFKYLLSGIWTDVDSTTYQVVLSNTYSKIAFLPDESFPDDADDQQQNVKITFNTGLFNSIYDVNADIKQAILMIIASLNQYRGDCIDSYNTESFIMTSQVPPMAQSILRQYRIESIY